MTPTQLGPQRCADRGSQCDDRNGVLPEAKLARKLVDEVFCHYSPLEQLHSDQGCQFESLPLAEVLPGSWEYKNDGLSSSVRWVGGAVEQDTPAQPVNLCERQSRVLGRLQCHKTNLHGL